MTQVTDAMIEAAVDAWFYGKPIRRGWYESSAILHMRAAIEAALAVAPKDAHGIAPSSIE